MFVPYNEQLENLRKQFYKFGFDLAWSYFNEMWLVVNYKPKSPETIKIYAILKNLSDLEKWIKEKEMNFSKVE